MNYYINQINRYVLQFFFSIEHTLQVPNLSLCSLKASDLDLLKISPYLSSYFLSLFLEELVPYYLGNSSIELCNSLGLSSDRMQHLYTQD